MLLESYRPKSQLVTKVTHVTKPHYPVVDAHNHLGDEFGGGWINRPINELIDILDEAGVTLYVDLDGGWGEDKLTSHINHLKSKFPDRFQVYGGINWNLWPTYGEQFPDWAASRIRAQAKDGAQGLKIWKNFGLSVRDHNGQLTRINDPRLDVIWYTAAELKLPVMIHVADPVAFFDPLDEYNERWEELHENPDWHFPTPTFPPFSDVINDFRSLIIGHPETLFIGAHVGCYAENLTWVGNLMDTCSNFYVDISARIGELGRQPYTTRKFFLKYSDRILFGTDSGPNLQEYQLAYRFLESDDEYFNYNVAETPKQGRWYVYGIFLPDEVLKKVYNGNAIEIYSNYKVK